MNAGMVKIASIDKVDILKTVSVEVRNADTRTGLLENGRGPLAPLGMNPVNPCGVRDVCELYRERAANGSRQAEQNCGAQKISRTYCCACRSTCCGPKTPAWTLCVICRARSEASLWTEN